jgi:hypothetical protein
MATIIDTTDNHNHKSTTNHKSQLVSWNAPELRGDEDAADLALLLVHLVHLQLDVALLFLSSLSVCVV